MKYHIEVDDESLEVRILEHAGSRWRVEVGGQELTLDLVDGHVISDDESIRFSIVRDEHGEPRSVLLKRGGGPAREVPVEVEGLRKVARPKARSAARAPVGGSVSAPMNGQVVKVLRAAGDDVEKGDVILVLEAMKMENEVTTPVAGRLASVHVQPGVTVKPGHPLFEVEPSK